MIPKEFRDPGLRPKISGAPGLLDKNIGAPGLHDISFGAPHFTVIYKSKITNSCFSVKIKSTFRAFPDLRSKKKPRLIVGVGYLCRGSDARGKLPKT